MTTGYNAYKKRSVSFLEVLTTHGWKVKLYNISSNSNPANTKNIEAAKLQLPQWLKKSDDYELPNYKVAILIIHEGKGGCFAIISWWTDENMLQLFAHLATDRDPSVFKPYADNSIITCVWEMAVLWHERNAWVEQVLKNPGKKDALDCYLLQQMNADV